MKFVPGGVSKKSGNSYDAFWSCPSGNKDHPTQKAAVAQQSAPTTTQVVRPMVQPDAQTQKYLDDEKDKQARIARESLISSFSTIMAAIVARPGNEEVTFGNAVERVIRASDKAMVFVYDGLDTEDVDDSELPF